MASWKDKLGRPKQDHHDRQRAIIEAKNRLGDNTPCFRVAALTERIKQITADINNDR